MFLSNYHLSLLQFVSVTPFPFSFSICLSVCLSVSRSHSHCIHLLLSHSFSYMYLSHPLITSAYDSIFPSLLPSLLILPFLIPHPPLLSKQQYRKCVHALATKSRLNCVDVRARIHRRFPGSLSVLPFLSPAIYISPSVGPHFSPKRDGTERVRVEVGE